MSLSKASIKVGDTHSAVVVDNLTRTQIVQYAGASGDYNPLHTDEIYATKVAGFPTVFAHGMLTMGLTARLVTDWVGDGRLLTLGSRFERQVWPGDTLTATATVDAIEESDEGPVVQLSIVTVNQGGDRVLSGTASARLDP
jgi:acyl dehydratase